MTPVSPTRSRSTPRAATSCSSTPTTSASASSPTTSTRSWARCASSGTPSTSPTRRRGRTDRRRVSGLRREEVALLAGISSEYYIRLERGNATGISESVIDGIAHALQLDEAERAHLLDLIRTAGTTRPPRRRPARQRVRPTVQRVLDSMVGTPGFVLNGRLDILAANDLGFALFSPVYADPVPLPRSAGDGVLR